MGKKKASADKALVDGYEIDEKLEAVLENIIDDEPAVAEASAQTVKIRLGVAVNGFKRGDELVVERDHPLFGGLIDQGIAEVIG